MSEALVKNQATAEFVRRTGVQLQLEKREVSPLMAMANVELYLLEIGVDGRSAKLPYAHQGPEVANAEMALVAIAKCGFYSTLSRNDFQHFKMREKFGSYEDYQSNISQTDSDLGASALRAVFAGHYESLINAVCLDQKIERYQGPGIKL